MAQARRPRQLARALAGGICLLLAAAARPAAVSAVQGAPPVIDGELDDAAWTAVEPIDAFVQVLPQPGAAPTRRTELRLVHDGAMLYVAVRAFDPDPSRIVVRSLRRDDIDADDRFTLVVDPRGDGRNGFAFRVNALGAKADALVFDGHRLRAEWDIVWRAAARIDALGWSVEFAIPLAALAAPSDGRDCRFNAERVVAASGETMRLFDSASERGVESLAGAAPLAGIVAVRQGLGLRLQPSLRWVRDLDARRRGSVEPGLDVFHMPVPGVTTTLTLNADFSDAELDDRVVNLSRFELFRPEKRAFFTQDAGRFAFGSLDGDDDPALVLFFSRCVGLGRTIDAGVKLSGSAGNVEFGVLGAKVAAGSDGGGTRVGVMRVATGIGAAQRLGAIATLGNPAGTKGSALAGLDYQLRRTDVLGDRTVEADGWMLASDNAGSGRGFVYGGSVRFPNDGPNGSLDLRQIGRHFLPALGYLREAGVRSGSAAPGWLVRTRAGGSIEPRLHADARRRLDGTESSRSIGAGLGVANLLGDSAELGAGSSRETIAEPFRPLPSLTVASGSYRSSDVSLSVTTARRERCPGRWDGTAATTTAGARWSRPSAWPGGRMPTGR